MSFIREQIVNGHVRHGLKVGIASVLSYYVSGLVGIPYAYWAVITTVIVMQMYVADSINMCLYRFTGTAIGAAMGILLILAFPPTPGYTMVGIFVGAGSCAYLTRYNERFRMAAITVAIVFLTSLGADNRIEFTLFRVVEIGVGVLCAFVVSVTILPRRVGAALREKLGTQYAELATHYIVLMDNFLKRQKKSDPDMFFDLVAQDQQNREMLHKVLATESRLFRDDLKLLSLQVNALHSVLERVQSLPSLLNDVEEEDGFDIIMAPELLRLAKAISLALQAIGDGVPHDRHELAAAVDAIELRFYELRSQGVTGRFSVRRLFQVLSFINTSQNLGEYVLSVLNRPEMDQLQ